MNAAHTPEYVQACVNACAGLPEGAIAGGWTALGLSRYAKGLEDEIKRLKGIGAASEPASTARQMASVDAKALRTVLQALVGPPHHMREIQMTRGVAALTGDDPIQTLIDDFNAYAAGTNKASES